MRSVSEKSEFCRRVLDSVEAIIACSGDSLDIKALADNLSGLVESENGVQCLPRGLWRMLVERLDYMLALPPLAADDARKLRREILLYENERLDDMPSFL